MCEKEGRAKEREREKGKKEGGKEGRKEGDGRKERGRECVTQIQSKDKR